MSIESLIGDAKVKITGRIPRYIDLNAAIFSVKTDIADAVMSRCHSALEEAILGAQSVLKTTCQQYIDDLYIADDFTIQVRDSSRHLEHGYAAREMKEDLLSSPKAKMNDKGNRRVVVPIGKSKGSSVSQAIEKKTSELFSKGKQNKASSRTLGDMVDEMRNLARTATDVSAKEPSKDGFRTVSDSQDSSNSWVHPGFEGVNQLESINQRLRVDIQEEVIRIIEAEVDRMRL